MARLAYVLLSLLIFCYVDANAQRNKNWYFGLFSSVKFDGLNNPTAQTNSSMYTQGGATAMSDKQGNLLFYSNGLSIWDKTHSYMLNGNSINGASLSNYAGWQGCVSVPMPGNDSLYYLFTTPATDFNGPNFANYHIININKNGGMGEVISKNNLMPIGNTTTAITAIKHSNDKDFWIILCEKINFPTPNFPTTVQLKFHAYLLSNSGLSNMPIISSITLYSYYSFNAGVGGGNYTQLIGSPNGKYIFYSNETNNVDNIRRIIFQFNNLSGIISNRINLRFYGFTTACFSPDSKRLYINNNLNGVLQLSLNIWDSAAIVNSGYVVTNTTTPNFGNAIIGSDEKIYIARANTNNLSCIANPNDSAASCNFIDNGINLLTGQVKYNLLNFYNDAFKITPKIATITIQPISCRKYAFSFTSSFTGITIKDWQLGDGTTKTDSSFIYTYTTTADSVLVKLTLTKPNSTDTLLTQQWLHIPKNPISSFTYQTNGCVRDSIFFNGSSTQISTAPINSIQWQLGDNTTANNVLQFAKLYTDTGTYTIKLWVKDTLGCTSDTASKTIAINKKVVSGFNIGSSICNNAPILLNSSAVAYNTNITTWKYFISNGDSVINTTNGNGQYAIANTGNYTIKQVAISNNGCLSDTTTKPITIYAKPTAQFALPQNCVLDVSRFTNNSNVAPNQTISNWLWHFGDANATITNPNIATNPNPTHQYTQAALYNVQLIATTNRGCSDTLTKPFTINGAVPQALLAIPAQSFCSSDSTIFTNNSLVNFGSIIELAWYWGNGDSTLQSNPAVGSIYRYKYAEFGVPQSINKTVRLQVKSGINCIAIKDTIIALKAQPRVAFSSMNDVCKSASPIVLNQGSITNGAIASSMYWGNWVSFNAGSYQYMFNPQSALVGTSAITYKVTTALGCSDSAVQNIKVLPVPLVDAGANQTIFEGGSSTINAMAIGNGLSYTWLPAIELSNAGILNPVTTATNTRLYQLTVANSDGCVNSDTVRITVLKSVIVPNVFSPNGDGINDVWNIAFLNSYPSPVVEVFNRYGTRVLYSNGFYTPWNGTLNGKPLPVGTYYYIINPGSGRKLVSGNVSIVR